MRCPKCGKECNEQNATAKNTQICLFCEKDFSRDENAKEDIGLIINLLC